MNTIEFKYVLSDKKSKWPASSGSGSSTSPMQGTGVGHPFIRYVKTGLFYDNINSVWRYPINSQRDSSQFDWKSSNNPRPIQNDDTVFISDLFGPFKTISPYGGDSEFSNYGEPTTYTIQFFWRSSSPAGLDNPYRNTNAYYNQFAGRTMRLLIDGGSGKRDSQVILDETGARDSGGVSGCFS